MANPLTLCLDITGRAPGSAFTALLMLTFDSGNSEYTMKGSGTVGGGAVSLSIEDTPCGAVKQSWTCEVPSATNDSAEYILVGSKSQDGGGGTTEGSIPRGGCGIPNPLPCAD